MYNFDPYNVLLAIATNIPVLLMTGFVVSNGTQLVQTATDTRFKASQTKIVVVF